MKPDKHKAKLLLPNETDIKNSEQKIGEPIHQIIILGA